MVEDTAKNKKSMILTEQEKQKIKEEELYRASVRAKNKNPNTAAILILFFGAFGWFYLNKTRRFFDYILGTLALLVLTFIFGAIYPPLGATMTLLMFVWHFVNVFWAKRTAKEMRGEISKKDNKDDGNKGGMKSFRLSS